VTDVNEIKAGKYELVAERWDKITSKPTEPLDFVRYRKGDVIDLNVDEARRLVLAGAVVKPGSREEAQATAALQQLRVALEALTPEQRQALLATGESVETPTVPKKRAAKKSVAKNTGAPVTVAPTPPVTPGPAGPSEEPTDGDDGDGDSSPAGAVGT
jgi:hypothetical protein